MRGRFYDGEDAGFAGRAAARELYRELYFEALRELCDVYAEALTPELRAELADVCGFEPCCRRGRRRRGSRKRLDEYLAAVIRQLGEQVFPPRESEVRDKR